jgi:hypothetical protein
MALTAAARLARPARWPGVLAWSGWTLTMLILAAVGVSDQFLRDMGRPDLVQMDVETLPPMLAAVSAATVGAVLAVRRPRHPVGWLLQGIALSLGLTAVVAQYLVGAVPVLLLGVVTLAGGAPRTSYRGVGSPLDLNRFSGVVLVANRLALALTILGVVLGGVIGLAALSLGATMVLGWTIGVSMAILPVAVGAAVLRYRLYDLDRIVSRTLAYGLLTVLLGGGYAALVLGLSQLVGQGLQPRGGRRHPGGRGCVPAGPP